MRTPLILLGPLALACLPALAQADRAAPANDPSRADGPEAPYIAPTTLNAYIPAATEEALQHRSQADSRDSGQESPKTSSMPGMSHGSGGHPMNMPGMEGQK